MRKVALLALAVLLNGNVYADGDALDNLPYARAGPAKSDSRISGFAAQQLA